MRAILVVTVAALAAPAFASGPLVDINWTDGRFVHEAAVEPGKFLEVCGRLAPGDTVRWRFDAAAPLDFNIHYHVGKDVRYPAKQAAMSRGEDVLRVEAREDHCWMWTNKSGGRVKIGLQLQR